MKRNLLIGLSVVLALSCVFGIAVYATGELTQSTPKIAVSSYNNYFAYYNDNSMKGAVAFSIDNVFTQYGTSAEPLKVCIQNEDGSFSTVHTIAKENVKTWFGGRTDYTVSTGDELSSILGGLSGVGLTFESNKTNFMFQLKAQKIEKGTEYFVWVPENYFADANGTGNSACYLTINPADINNYTGDILTDLQTATGGIYDSALFAAESVGSILP